VSRLHGSLHKRTTQQRRVTYEGSSSSWSKNEWDLCQLGREAALIHCCCPALPCPANCLQAGGLSPALVHRLLRNTNPSPLLIDALTIISQLARVQQSGGACNMYESLLKSNLLPLIRQLLVHEDPGVY